MDDWQKFIKQSDSSITVIEKKAKELKDKIAKVNAEEKAKLNSELNKLEQN
jgi:hypothetical protein